MKGGKKKRREKKRWWREGRGDIPHNTPSQYAEQFLLGQYFLQSLLPHS